MTVADRHTPVPEWSRSRASASDTVPGLVTAVGFWSSTGS